MGVRGAGSCAFSRLSAGVPVSSQKGSIYKHSEGLCTVVGTAEVPVLEHLSLGESVLELPGQQTKIINAACVVLQVQKVPGAETRTV